MMLNKQLAQPVDIKSRIKEEQNRLSFHQLPFVIFLPPVSGLILGFLLWGYVSHITISVWLAAVFCCCTLAGSVLLWYRRKIGNQLSPDSWAHIMLAFSVVGGGAWGVGGYFLFAPEHLGYVGLLFLWMYMPAASGTMVTLAYPPLFYSITLVMLLPLTIRCVVEGGVVNITLAITTVIFAGCLYYFHTHIHRMLMESMRLRFEKSDLLDEVTLRKEIAEHANSAKSRFLAAASHDLRQPLHAQTLFVAELKHRIEEPESKKIVDHLESSIESVSELFNSLLDISRLDANVVKSTKQACSMSTLLEKIENEFSAIAIDKGLGFRVVPCAHTIYSDCVLLGRILQNFVSNAIRYTDSGSVMVCCRVRRGNLRIEVRDSGLGIEEDKHQEIFEEFLQLHNPERDRQKGLGLGLSIVSRLAELLGHEISLNSVIGKGSVFNVDVPIYQGLPFIASTNPGDVDDSEIKGVRVLVIDNEESIRRGMHGLLHSWGCVVEVVSGFADALHKLTGEQFEPQVIISDYRLPDDENGIDTLNRLQEHSAHDATRILLTGDTASYVLQRANMNNIEVLHKPVTIAQLRLAISSVE